MFHLSDLFHRHKKHDEADADKKNPDEQENINEDEYTNIVTVDGKRLKKIPGGYTLSGTGGDYYEDDIVSV